MILDISDSTFRNIFQDKSLHLPIRWNGNDFYDCLDNLFKRYRKAIESTCPNLYENQAYNNYDDLRINRVCNLIKKSVKHYLDGFPAKAYNTFASLMGLLQQNPLRVYQKSCYEIEKGYNDRLNLFRVAAVDENIPYPRARIFHTPYNLRSRVSTSRYSIAGYPSLYLGTSLELCCEEVHYNPHKGFALASKFKFERNATNNDTIIDVIELAVKPQDFFEENRNNDFNRRKFDEFNLDYDRVRGSYLLWYPLIAACSFIRTNKSHPFAAEYIVPQLLMQWVRSETLNNRYGGHNRLIGIRYFSCASVRASDMGFNYVFPVSGAQISPQLPYCPILSRAFRLTNPRFINEYFDVSYCERALINDNNIDFIDA